MTPPNKSELIDKLIEKHTIALTSNTEILPVGADPELGHGGEDPITIQSFDTRVVNTFELSKDLQKAFREVEIEAQVKELPFLRTMYADSQKLLNQGFDLVTLQDLDKRIEDWLAELTNLRRQG